MAGAVAILVVLGLALAWHPALPARADAPAAFDPAAVERGARLAALGDCTSCHTADERPPFAGGVALATPFGTLHGTNVTPDRETGIGAWSEAAFVRAMRRGVARDGSLLYPAFPYDHFTHVTDDDLHALYAYLMTRDPVRAPNPPNDLRFPFGMRPLIAGWNLLYLRGGPVAAEPSRGPEWNRGAYLVQSLGHCSGCHAPRSALGGEESDRGLAGGGAEGWYAPALDGRSPSPTPWTIDQLVAYLRTGIAAEHAMAAGPMQEVVVSLAQASEEDVRAIATYIHAGLGPPPEEREKRAAAARERASVGPLARVPVAASAVAVASAGANAGTGADADRMRLGATVYEGACARCHDVGRAVGSNGALRLPLAVAVYDPDPRSLLRIVRHGIAPPSAQPGRWMPAFGETLTDEQLAALLAWLRVTAAQAPPWPDLDQAVRETRTPS